MSRFWNETAIEPKRSFRWLVYFAGAPQFIAKSVKKPSFSVTETPHEFLNYKFYYPGRVEWNTVDLTLVDPVQPDSAASLMKILENMGYVIPSDYNNQDGKPKTISKENAIASLGSQVKIQQIGSNTTDAQSVPLEEWTLNNPFINSVDFGTLDYSSDELINISVTLRYDWATMVHSGGPGNLWQMNPQG